MDADGLTFACAMTVEERIARRFGRTAVVGLGASKGVPEGRLVSFGIAGALSGELPVGTVIDATRVVDESGAVLWEGGPLGATAGAHRDDPRCEPDRRRSRRSVHGSTRDTGADAVDMESGAAGAQRPAGRLPARDQRHADAPARRRRRGRDGRTARSTTPGFLRGLRPRSRS